MSTQDNDNAGTQEGPDFLNMSDDDIANFDPSTLSQATGSEAEQGTEQRGNDDGSVTETDEDKAATAAAAAALEDDDNKAGDGKGADDAGDNKEGTGTPANDEGTGTEDPADTAGKDDAVKDVTDPAAKADDGKDTKAEPAKADPATTDAATTAVVDYEAAYKQLMAPFKANGRDITPKSPEDAIALMQMGANYNKKMAGMKPSLKLLKMLETNGLLDEAQLGFLIDVHKRDPAAINKLIIDSKMDPLDLSADKAGEYKPGNHKVNDQEMELDAVLEELKYSPTYNQTLQVVSTDWDEDSRSTVVKHPQVLKTINGHIASGIYAIIQAEMDSERTFGRLQGLSDIDAYQKVGDAIQARGGFNHLNVGSSQVQGKPAATAPVIVTPKPTKDDEDKLKDRRKAASGTKTAPPNKGIPDDFNILKMSDADFANFKI